MQIGTGEILFPVRVDKEMKTEGRDGPKTMIITVQQLSLIMQE